MNTLLNDSRLLSKSKRQKISSAHINNGNTWGGARILKMSIQHTLSGRGLCPVSLIPVSCFQRALSTLRLRQWKCSQHRTARHQRSRQQIRQLEERGFRASVSCIRVFPALSPVGWKDSIMVYTSYWLERKLSQASWPTNQTLYDPYVNIKR